MENTEHSRLLKVDTAGADWNGEERKGGDWIGMERQVRTGADWTRADGKGRDWIGRFGK